MFAERLEAAPPPARLAAGVAVMVAEPPAAVEDAQPSIAVMPLTLRSDLPDGPLIAAGLAIDVIGLLTRFRRLDVIAYNSTCAIHQSLPARELGSRLGARYVTQGVLWLTPSRIRLTFDLILTETEKVVWSHDFDRTWDDLFEVQREVAGAVASGMMVEIEYRERTRVRARDPSSLDAYALWLRGLDDMLSYDRQRCQTALGYFSRAVEVDETYARALSGISRAHGFRWMYRWAERREAALAEAEEWALQAVDADAHDPGARAALGWVSLYQRDHDRSLDSYQQALDLNPSDADALAEYADALKHSGAPAEFGAALRARHPAQPLLGGPLPPGPRPRPLRARGLRGGDPHRAAHAAQEHHPADPGREPGDARPRRRRAPDGPAPARDRARADASGGGLGDDDPRPRPEPHRPPARRHEAGGAVAGPHAGGPAEQPLVGRNDRSDPLLSALPW